MHFKENVLNKIHIFSLRPIRTHITIFVCFTCQDWFSKKNIPSLYFPLFLFLLYLNRLHEGSWWGSRMCWYLKYFSYTKDNTAGWKVERTPVSKAPFFFFSTVYLSKSSGSRASQMGIPPSRFTQNQNLPAQWFKLKYPNKHCGHKTSVSSHFTTLLLK